MSSVTDTRARTTDAPEAARGRHGRRNARLRSLAGWGVFIVAIVLVSTLVRAFALQTYYVPTPSMTPTLLPGDRIIVAAFCLSDEPVVPKVVLLDEENNIVRDISPYSTVG